MQKPVLSGAPRESLLEHCGKKMVIVGPSSADPLLNLLRCRHLANTYGPGWEVPDTVHHGITQQTPDVRPIQQALLSRLSVTAWGDVPWPERKQRCAEICQAAAKSQSAASELLLAMLEGPDMDHDPQHSPGQPAAAACGQQQSQRDAEQRPTQQRPTKQQPTEQRNILKQLAGEATDAQSMHQDGFEQEVH
jgi:hypothetical protein